MPRIDQYRVRLEACPLAKASHWGDLRRQGRFCLRRESGDLLFRQSVAENGCGDILVFAGISPLFCFVVNGESRGDKLPGIPWGVRRKGSIL